jgi:hypothetical protein
MTTFKAGDKVKVVNNPEHVRNGHEAKICTVPPDDSTSYLIMFDDERTFAMHTRYLELITAAPKKDDYADMSAEEQVAVLTEELYQVSRSYIAASTHRDNLEHDLRHYDTVMRETKDDQDWCDEGSNKVIATLNEGFKAHYIDPYESEFEIEYEITAGVTVRGTVMITASCEDAARDFFNDDPESFINPESEAMDEVRSLGWDNCEVEVI